MTEPDKIDFIAANHDKHKGDLVVAIQDIPYVQVHITLIRVASAIPE